MNMSFYLNNIFLQQEKMTWLSDIALQFQDPAAKILGNEPVRPVHSMFM
jgi:hypothetical protein